MLFLHTVVIAFFIIFLMNHWCVRSLTAEASSQRTLFEYHRVEVDTAQVTTNSAIEFTALPSKSALSVKHCQWNTLFVLPLYMWFFLYNFLFFLLACLQHDSCELCHSFNQTLGCTWCHVLQRSVSLHYYILYQPTDPGLHDPQTNIHVMCTRCSDGMDRHRQEWLEYSCSDEVLL